MLNLTDRSIEFLLAHVERHGDGDSSPKAGALLDEFRAEHYPAKPTVPLVK